VSLVYAKTGQALQLGPELARGGEGAIYSIAGVTDRVAKIYLKAPTDQKIAKLEAMTSAPEDRLTSIAAWPLDIVKDGAKVKGFVMPRLGSHRDVFELYSPKGRASAFPEADFRFITHVAGNTARAFAQVHAAGYVIGDVNHAHLLVARDARVALIDCDSFQVKIAAQTLTCNVGQALFTPPELQGASFSGLQRTAVHDQFGLAVLLFHLLFMGRHPFSGVWNGPGDMPIERAIKEYRFAYGAARTSLGMKPPPATVALQTMGSEVASMFERAFARNAVRPAASDWVAPLKALESSLKQCAAVSAHHYPNQNTSCPWCAVERQSGVRLFGQRIVTAPGQTSADVATLWRTIEQIASPSADPPLPSAKPWTPPQGTASTLLKQARIWTALIFAAGGLVGCANTAEGGAFLGGLGLFACWLVWPRPSPEKVRAAAAATEQARSTWTQLESRWRREASVEAFLELKADLLAAKNELEGLPARRAREMAKLQNDREAQQKRAYLDRFHIKDGRIHGIGPSRVATLASFGIETAADVDRNRIMRLHGFGPSLCSALLEWRKGHEANFRFNTAAPVDPREVQRIDAELSSRRTALVRQMQQGPTKLQYTKQTIEGARARLGPLMQQAWDAFQLAQAQQAAL
jgi:DNA-binding helix-hairpin-helix protein with protein kinase domain